MLELKELLKESQNQLSPEEYLIKIHYIFCRKFHWIPLEEFKKLPLPLVFNFISCIDEENKINGKH